MGKILVIFTHQIIDKLILEFLMKGDPSGEKTKVEFSFVYKKNKEGEIKIVLHHSSLPFSM